ncbi:hypothetical protein KP509_31G010100 [Ceratopteris richardii]|nr:hypothetical protein KP509_31G010100 [Ceratopteris richardii]
MENADRIVPRVAIKFGKVIFHCRGGSLERSGGFLRNAIEAKDGRLRDLSKTFDNSVSEEKYSLLYNIAFRNAEKTWSRERYTVQVSDETNPGKQLLCVCMGAKSNEQLQHCSISSSGSCLKMIKVKFATVRYFICDMACVKKTSDIRLMLCTKNYCTGLNEEELEDLESCFSNVSLIPNVKGGLHWPAGSKQSRSGRFKVLGSTHSEKVVFVGRGLRWSLQKRNRIEFKASSGRVSYEVNIRPTSYDKFCQGPEDMSIEDLLSLILEVIDQAWEQFV